MDETPVEICKTKEGLYVFDFPRLGPFLYRLDLSGVHHESGRRQYISEVFDGVLVKGTFICTGIKSVISESSEYFADMFPMVDEIVGVDQNVVQIDENAYVQEIREDVVHETLKSGGGIGKSERHNAPLKRAIASAKCGFPFVTFSNPDKVVGMPEIDLCKVTCLLWTVKEVGDAGERISVFLRDLVQATEIDAKSE